MSLQGSAKGKTLRGKINRLYELRGYSAYEVAVINGFSGTEEEWLISLNGGAVVSTEYIGQDENGGNMYRQNFDNGVTNVFVAPKGADGAIGRDGEKGDTPVKGVDYYTEADKAEMVSAVIAALPVYNGEVAFV